jgi:hypothetical protein
MSPSSSAVTARTLRIEIRREAATGPSAGVDREELPRRPAIADDPVLADPAGVGGDAVAVVVEEVGAVEEAGAGAVAVVVEEVGAVVAAGARSRRVTEP